jgi:signal transduction histidine kinase
MFLYPLFDRAEIQVTMGKISPTIVEALLAELRGLAGSAQTVRALDWKGLGTIRVASAPIGFRGTAFLVAGAWRPDFLDDAQKFLLKFAADEAAPALLRRRSEIDEQRFLTLINRAPDFIGVASHEGVPHFINPAGLALVGLSSLEDARRRHILDFVAANERSRVEETWPTVIDAGYWSGADRIQVQQVLFNLMRNAVEAMSEVEHKELTVSAAKMDKDTIEVCVTDSGLGMTDEIREHLFEPFYSTKRNGMGLGLSICQSIINAHGGELHYQPNPRGGAVFRFTLPGDAGGEVDAE